MSRGDTLARRDTGLILWQRLRTGLALQLSQGEFAAALDVLGTDSLALQVYAIIDEFAIAGEIEETSKQVILSRLEMLESLP